MNSYSASASILNTGDLTHSDADAKRTEESKYGLYSLRNFLVHVPDALIVTNSEGGVHLLNKHAEALFGYKHSDVFRQDVNLLFDCGLKEAVKPVKSVSAPHPKWRATRAKTVRGRKSSGEVFPAEVAQTSWVLDQMPVIIYRVKDLSLGKWQQQRIAELERENAHLLKHSLLGELATAITHELAQPLTAIANYTAAAGRSWRHACGAASSDAVELVRKAGEQAKRAWLIMNRLRNLLQHRGAEFAHEDLRRAVEEAVELATLGASDHGIAVHIDLPPEPVIVNMDRIQVQILIANLIRNAVDELSAVNGERSIWIALRVNAGREAEVTVEDTGPGISGEAFEHIFDPFHTTKTHGLGVGLAVSRRIAAMHGGRMAARNRLAGGACFSFIVPVVSKSENIKNE